MSYYVPQNYQCPKCHELFQWSQDFDQIGLGKPFCPQCYINFILENVPIGER